MKKIISLLLVWVILFSFAACEPETEESPENGYEDTLKLYEEIYNGDLEKIRQTAPQKVWEHYEKETGKTVEDVIADSEATYQSFVSEIKAQHGSDFTISLSIKNSEHCDIETVEKIGKALKNDYNMNENAITDAYKITMAATVTAGEESEAGDAEYYLIMIENHWYLASYIDMDGEDFICFAFV